AYLTTSRADAEPFTPTFRRRNEVLVALCDVLLLGETGTPSGALNAAQYAREANLPHFLLPWSTRALDTRGTQAEFGRHVPGYFNPVQLVELLSSRVFDNVDYWERSVRAAREHTRALEKKDEQRSGRKKQRAAAAPPGARVSPTAAPELDDPVACAIARGATTIDAIAERTRLAAAVVQHRVLLLTLQGAILRDGSGLLRVRG